MSTYWRTLGTPLFIVGFTASCSGRILLGSMASGTGMPEGRSSTTDASALVDSGGGSASGADGGRDAYTDSGPVAESGVSSGAEGGGGSGDGDGDSGSGADAGAPATLRSAAVVLFGGQDANGGVLGDTWEWNGTTWTNIDAGVGPSPRTGAAMAPLGSEVLLFGGFDGAGLLADTWKWDGTSWTLIPQDPNFTPLPRQGALMAAYAGAVILFSGKTQDFGASADTYQFNGPAGWTPLGAGFVIDQIPWGMVSVPVVPGPCMTNDGARLFVCTNELLILFGAGSSENETWAFDGGTWAQIDVGASTSNAYPRPTSLSLLGGFGNSILLLDVAAGETTPPATWEWNAGAWSPLQVTGPAPVLGNVSGAMMVPFRDGALLFGQDSVSETWIWNGATWSEPSLPTMPAARTGEAMATRFAP